MNMRPFDDTLVTNCVHNDYCFNCKLRVGCPIRKSFYNVTDLQHEIILQTSEIKMRQAIRSCSEEEVLDYTNRLRRKRDCEIKQNPVFSYH